MCSPSFEAWQLCQLLGANYFQQSFLHALKVWFYLVHSKALVILPPSGLFPCSVILLHLLCISLIRHLDNHFFIFLSPTLIKYELQGQELCHIHLWVLLSMPVILHKISVLLYSPFSKKIGKILNDLSLNLKILFNDSHTAVGIRNVYSYTE